MSEGKLPILSGREIIKVLALIGFRNTRKAEGSHFRYVHSDGRKTISRGLLRKILRDTELFSEEFITLLKK